MKSFSRRNFLKTSSVATAVTAAGIKPAAANHKINAAVIGCRNRGGKDAAYFLDSGQFNIVTVCDCDKAMFGNALDRIKDKVSRPPKQETDFRRVLEDRNVDAVIVATPDHWHALQTCMALDAGKHVFLEKPASYNINDGKAMVAAQKKHPDRVVMIGTQQRSGPHFFEAKEFIESGGLGKVGFCRGCIVHERPVLPIVPDTKPPETLDYSMWTGPAPLRPYNEYRVHYNWHFVREYGTGEMGNWGAHWLDVIRWFMNVGFPTAASGAGGQYVVKDAKEWPDTQTVIYEYPELTVLWEMRLWSKFGVGGRTTRGCEFNGEKGSLTIDRGGWTFYPRDGEPEQHRGRGLDIPHVTNFADAIRGEAKTNASIEEGHTSATLCHLGNISADLGTRVQFDPKRQTIVGNPIAKKMMGRKYRSPWSIEEFI